MVERIKMWGFALLAILLVSVLYGPRGAYGPWTSTDDPAEIGV